MANSLFGSIANPTKYTGNEGQGLFALISNILKLAGVIGAIYMVIQIILAGFDFISASGDEKKFAAAWAKIWQSLVGLAIIASAFVIAAIVGRILGINILNPTISGPGE